MTWFGRWVTSYKDNDPVQFILKETGLIEVGVMKLPDEHFSKDWYVDSDVGKLTTKDILVLSPCEHWYKDNPESMYDSFLENWFRKER